MEELIDKFVKKNQLPGDESILVNRETFWMDVVKFYKKALSKPDILRKELYVTFQNEEGLDGGAMKVEFFTLTLNEIQKLINNSLRKFQRNTFLISVFICDKDFSSFA